MKLIFSILVLLSIGFATQDPYVDYDPESCCSPVGCTGVPNLLVNGDFEDTPCASASFCTYEAGSSLVGWTVQSGDVDVCTGYFQPEHGSKSIDLTGFVEGSISQTVSLTPGQYYYLSFWLAGNAADHSEPTKSLDVQITSGGSEIVNSVYVFNITQTSLAKMGWIPIIVGFVAGSSADTTITFTSLSSLSDGGPAIDNVILDLGEKYIGYLSCFCSGMEWTGDIGYFCPFQYSTFFIQCLNGEFEVQDAQFNCPAVTHCNCAPGTECSQGGTASPCQY